MENRNIHTQERESTKILKKILKRARRKKENQLFEHYNERLVGAFELSKSGTLPLGGVGGGWNKKIRSFIHY